MIISIVLVHFLNNGSLREVENFQGNTSNINTLLEKCEKLENKNTGCFLYQERDKNEKVLTYLPTMQQIILKG